MERVTGIELTAFALGCRLIEAKQKEITMGDNAILFPEKPIYAMDLTLGDN